MSEDIFIYQTPVTKTIKIEFYKNGIPYIGFAITCQGIDYRGCFSSWRFKCIKRWLETIVLGAEFSTLSILDKHRLDFSYGTEYKRVFDDEGIIDYKTRSVELFSVVENADKDFRELAKNIGDGFMYLHNVFLDKTDKVLLRVNVDRKQFVGAFYFSLLEFINTNFSENNCYGIPHLFEFRSEIIEKYLTEK